MIWAHRTMTKQPIAETLYVFICYLILQQDTPDAISWLSRYSVNIWGKKVYLARQGCDLDRWAVLDEESTRM